MKIRKKGKRGMMVLNVRDDTEIDVSFVFKTAHLNQGSQSKALEILVEFSHLGKFLHFQRTESATYVQQLCA